MRGGGGLLWCVPGSGVCVCVRECMCFNNIHTLGLLPVKYPSTGETFVGIREILGNDSKKHANKSYIWGKNGSFQVLYWTLMSLDELCLTHQRKTHTTDTESCKDSPTFTDVRLHEPWRRSSYVCICMCMWMGMCVCMGVIHVYSFSRRWVQWDRDDVTMEPWRCFVSRRHQAKKRRRRHPDIYMYTCTGLFTQKTVRWQARKTRWVWHKESC